MYCTRRGITSLTKLGTHYLEPFSRDRRSRSFCCPDSPEPAMWQLWYTFCNMENWELGGNHFASSYPEVQCREQLLLRPDAAFIGAGVSSRDPHMFNELPQFKDKSRSEQTGVSFPTNLIICIFIITQLVL